MTKQITDPNTLALVAKREAALIKTITADYVRNIKRVFADQIAEAASAGNKPAVAALKATQRVMAASIKGV